MAVWTVLVSVIEYKSMCPIMKAARRLSYYVGTMKALTASEQRVLPGN